MPNFSFDDLTLRGRRAYASILSGDAWRSVDALTVLKIVCLLLLFAPQWGLSWRVLDYFSTTSPPFRWNPSIVRSGLSVLRQSFLSGVVYAAVCFACYLGLFIIPFIRAGWLRVALVATLLLGCLFELTLFDVSGAFSSQVSLSILWGERSQAATLGFYWNEIVRNAAVILAVSVPLAMRPSGVGLAKKWAFVTLFAVILSGALTWQNPRLQMNVPVPMGVVSNAAAVIAAPGQIQVSPWINGIRPERDFTIPLPVAPGVEHIVVIMDESVRGDYLSLNNSELATTPFLAADPDVINFGVAISGANCSIFSRLMVRFGMDERAPSDWRAALNRPTMWEFAKRAGYDTAFVNAYEMSQQYWYAYSPVERRLIDRTLNVFDTPYYLRDFNLADVVGRALKESEGRRLFMYVDKYGTHPPYDNKFPPDQVRFAASGNSDVEMMTADYKNALSWSVDHFFERLNDRVDLGKTLILYTSDHGQSLFEGGYKQSHCSFNSKVVDGEGKVPLLAMTRVASFERELRKAAAADFSRFSHFDVFPTILEAMGYGRAWIAGKYRSSMLFGSHDEPRGFYIGRPQDAVRHMSNDDKSARR